MATATITTEKRVVLEMSEEEAKASMSALGNIIGSHTETARKYTSAVFGALVSTLGEDCYKDHSSPYYLPSTKNLLFPNPLPAPEPPPLTLAEIKQGEWFCLYAVMDSPRCRILDGYVDYMTIAMFHADSGNSRAWRKLTTEEARNLAKEKGYLFPF